MPFGPFALQWRTPSPNPPLSTPLPEGITRSSIHTDSGSLELLTALPSPSSFSNEKPPLLFAHGGFGCAEQWILYMQYFSARGYPCYAISYRGHGKSWYPGFWRMYFTTRHMVAQNLAAGVKYVEALEGARRLSASPEKVVLVAHSAGGALAQYALSRKMFEVQGFCMFAAVPGFGSWSCYSFWALVAPFNFVYRAFHSRYLLATTKQVQDAFFTAETPSEHVRQFAQLLAPYESMLWPIQGLTAFVTGPDVLSSIVGWARCNQRLFVLAAEKDALCTPAVLEDAAQRYRKAWRYLVSRNELGSESSLDVAQEMRPGSEDDGVRFKVVNEVAHHLQNHEAWEKGAEEVRKWLEQL